MKILSFFWWRFTYNLSLYWVDDSIDSPPLVAILGLSSDHAKALKDIDYVINSTSLNAELTGALIKEEQILLFLTVDAQKSAAELA